MSESNRTSNQCVYCGRENGEHNEVCVLADNKRVRAERDDALEILAMVLPGPRPWPTESIPAKLRIYREMAKDRLRPAHETTATPTGVLRWAEESFGPIARNRDERAARLAEEAMEVAQAEGVPLETLKRIADRIYSRPVGELGQEVGGLGITLYALAANCGLNLFGEIEREWKRVLSKPRDWWQRKHAEKVAAGTADLTPIQPVEPTPRIPPRSFNIERHMGLYSEDDPTPEKASEPLPLCDCDPDFGCKECDPKIFRCCQQEMEKRAAQGNGNGNQT